MSGVGNRARFDNIRRERLLDQAGDARLEQRLDDRAMGDGRRCNDNRIDSMSDQLLHIGEGVAAPFLGDCRGALNVSIDHANELATVGGRAKSRVMASHSTDADGG